MSIVGCTGAAINASAVVTTLGGEPSSGMCQCPAHDDARASLHVDERNGKLLVKCHAGCSQESVVTALRARGLWPTGGQREEGTEGGRTQEDAYDKFRVALSILRAATIANQSPKAYLRKRGIQSVPPCAMFLPAAEGAPLTGRRYPAMVMPVVNDAGLVGAHVVFLTRDGDRKLNSQSAKKSYGPIKGGYVQLSPLDDSQPLIVGEGVETVLAAMQLTGLPGIATLGTSGLKAVTLPAADEVIIAADNDAPGKEAARVLGQRLANEHRRVSIAVPEYEGYDWNDAMLRQGADPEKLRDALLAGRLVGAERRVMALAVEDFMNLRFPKREYLLRPWLPTGGIAMVHAQRGAAKTWFTLSVGHAVATGQAFLDWPCEREGRVLYVDGELPGALLQDRLRRFGNSPRSFLILSREQFHLGKRTMPDLGTEEGRAALDKIIDREEPDLVILDSVSTLVRTGVENEAESWGPVQDWLMSHRWRGRSTILIHHEGRSNKPRGTSKREDVLDTMIGLRRREPKHGEEISETDSSFDLTFTKTREFFGRDAEPRVLHLSTAGGTVSWDHETAREDRQDAVGRMLKAGFKGRDIARELGITEGRVSQIKRAIDEKARL